MPSGQPQNLAPAWQKGQAPRPSTRQQSDLHKAIKSLRRASPQAAKLCIDTMNDPTQDIELRLKVAFKILEATATPQVLRGLQAEDTVQSITITIQRHGDAENPSPTGITIDAEESSQTLTISTIPKGHGDD